MDEGCVSVHVHCMDADGVIEEYRQKGYRLKERTKPTIPAQIGFERFVFVPADYMDDPARTHTTNRARLPWERAIESFKSIWRRTKPG